MLRNRRALKTISILTMFPSSIRRSMGLSKLLEHGMNALGIFSLKRALLLERPILLFSPRGLAKISLYAKYMSMTLYLVLLTNFFVMSLVN